MNQDFELLGENLDSRVIAEQMGVKHDLLMQTLLKRYRNQLEKHGIILFQTGRIKKGDTEEDNGPSGVLTSEVQ